MPAGRGVGPEIGRGVGPVNADELATGRTTLPLSAGCVCTTPCVALYRLGDADDTAGRHHEDAVD